MTLLDRRTISVLVTILVFAGVLALVWLARVPLIAFTFAVLFAEFLEPVVARLQSWLRFSLGKAIAAVYLGIVVGLVVFGLTVGPGIVQQIKLLSATLPNLLENVKSGNVARQLGEQRGWSYDNQVRIQQRLGAHQSDIGYYARDAALRLEQLGANIPWILLVPVLAVFFLKDRSDLRNSVVQLIGASHNRAFLENAIDDLDTMLARYVEAQLLLSFSLSLPTASSC